MIIDPCKEPTALQEKNKQAGFKVTNEDVYVELYWVIFQPSQWKMTC